MINIIQKNNKKKIIFYLANKDTRMIPSKEIESLKNFLIFLEILTNGIDRKLYNPQHLQEKITLTYNIKYNY